MIRKNIAVTGGNNNQFHKHRYAGSLSRKLANDFWNCIDHLSCNIPKIASLYDKSISKRYEKESETFGITNESNILHIGCGAYPITAITLAKLNGSKIVGIDNNPKVIEVANQIIHKKDLHGQIIIERGDGTDYPVNQFDTIIISGCSSPKVKILEHIFKTARSQSKIIVREPEINTKSVIDCIDMNKDIIVMNNMRNRPFPLLGWRSFYLMKK